MIIFSLTFDAQKGWSAELPSGLDSPSTLVLAFSSMPQQECRAPLGELRRSFPRATMLGCSTAGEIVGPELRDGGIAVTVVRFERTRLRAVVVPVEAAADSYAAGVEAARGLAGDDLRGMLVLSDGLHINGSELVRGLTSVEGAHAPVAGGLAADGDRFRSTWVLDGDTPRERVVSALGLYGEAAFLRHGSRGGWDRFGPRRVVTRSEGNVLFELDRRPALDLYKEYLGERASGLPATALLFPLALTDSAGAAPVVRTVLSVDEERRSLTFAGDVPHGAHVQLMRANFERLVDGASGAVSELGLVPDGDVGPVLCVAISCVGRRLVLGERTEEELEATLDGLPRGATQTGFYSYGEISPTGVAGCELHNQTMTLTAIGER